MKVSILRNKKMTKKQHWPSLQSFTYFHLVNDSRTMTLMEKKSSGILHLLGLKVYFKKFRLTRVHHM